MTTKEEWNKVPNGWEEMPIRFRKPITDLYHTNNMLKAKKGETFTVGKILTKNIPQLKVVEEVTYVFKTWTYVPEKYDGSKNRF